MTGLFANPQAFLLKLICRLPAILISLSFHEWAHAYAAYKCGDPTARNLGRMSVNPFRHIDPIGFIMLLLVRFGWAKPVPINSRNFAKPRRDETIVSLAGVTANFALACIAMLLIYLNFYVFHFSNMIIDMVLLNFLFINLSLMVFNLIPIPPLDGSHVLENLLIRRVGPKPFWFLRQYGSYLLLAVLLLNTRLGFLDVIIDAIISGMSSVFGLLFGL